MCKTIEVMSHLLKIADRFCLNIVLLVRSLRKQIYFEFCAIKFTGAEKRKTFNEY